jgi:hypothetical protein
MLLVISSLLSDEKNSCAQIVFRSDSDSDSEKFKDFKRECNDFLKPCDEFLKLVTSLEVMVSNVQAMDLPQIVDQVCNWQVR